MYCIYRITNLVNGKTYIGQHKYSNEAKPMYKYWGSGKILKQAYKLYGKDHFKREVLYSRIISQETANSVEQFAINKERMLGKAEYNIAKGGDCGYHHRPTDETKKLISEGLKEYFKTDEGKAQIEYSKSKQSYWTKENYKWTERRAIAAAKRRHKVICVETGIIYNSIKEAEASVPHCGHKICEVLKGTRERAGGYHWRIVNE